MSKFFLTNGETGHPYFCECPSCLSRARSRLLFGLGRSPAFDLSILDMGKAPWPDEVPEEMKKREGSNMFARGGFDKHRAHY